nr:MAG TPA: hypothetical protein [Caudoviricetes sp.]
MVLYINLLMVLLLCRIYTKKFQEVLLLNSSKQMGVWMGICILHKLQLIQDTSSRQEIL